MQFAKLLLTDKEGTRCLMKKKNRHIDTLDDYKENLLDSVRDNTATTPRSFRNEKREHNAEIMNVMFMESDSVDMFCGEMSVLRDSFFSRMEDNGKRLKVELAANINSFLHANKKLRIFTLRYEPEMVKEFITPELRNHFGKGVEIYVPDQKMSLVPLMAHISVGRKNGHPFMIRIETNQETHSAICRIRPTKQEIKSADSSFKLLAIDAKCYSH